MNRKSRSRSRSRKMELPKDIYGVIDSFVRPTKYWAIKTDNVMDTKLYPHEKALKKAVLSNFKRVDDILDESLFFCYFCEVNSIYKLEKYIHCCFHYEDDKISFFGYDISNLVDKLNKIRLISFLNDLKTIINDMNMEINQRDLGINLLPCSELVEFDIED